MKAVQISQYGDAGVLTLATEAPKPVAGSGQVLIEVHAAGLNPVDTMIRLGYLQQMAPLKFPATLGLDLAGVVLEAGPGAGRLKAGDKVFGQAGAIAGASGAFAEYAAALAGQLAGLRPKLSFVEAAALPLAGVSALQAIYELLKLKSGSRVLIHGGAGGIGSLAIQMAKRLGAYVASTCRGESVSFVKGLGADEVIDYQSKAFQNLLQGFDAALDTVGGATYRDTYSVLRKGGMLVSMLEQPDAQLSAKYGVTALALMAQVNTERLERLSKLVADGTIRVQVGRLFPLQKAKEAFLAREGGEVRGKVVLQVRTDG